MRLTASEKQEIIHMVTRSDIGINRILKQLGLNKSTFYLWYKLYSDFGVDGLSSNKRCVRRHWNVIPSQQKNLVVELALEHTQLYCRELACKLTDEQQIFISESSVYRILKKRGLALQLMRLFRQLMNTKTRPNLFTRCGKRISPILE